MKGQRAVGRLSLQFEKPWTGEMPTPLPRVRTHSERCGNAYRPDAETNANSTEPQQRPRGTSDAVEKRAKFNFAGGEQSYQAPADIIALSGAKSFIVTWRMSESLAR